MKNLLYVLILIFLTSCSGKKDDKNITLKTPPNNSEEHWIVYHTTDSIPKSFMDALVHLHKGNFELANPDERFNATDNIIDSLPRQQLSLLSKKRRSMEIDLCTGRFWKI